MYYRIAVAREWDRMLIEAVALDSIPEDRMRELQECASMARDMAKKAILDFLSYRKA
jgi:hypothetical protein